MTFPLINPDSKVHGTNMGSIWGQQDPGGPNVGPMNFALWKVNISEASPIIDAIFQKKTLVWQLWLFLTMHIWIYYKYIWIISYNIDYIQPRKLRSFVGFLFRSRRGAETGRYSSALTNDRLRYISGEGANRLPLNTGWWTRIMWLYLIDI